MSSGCFKRRSDLFRYLDDELDENACHDLELHLASCRACAQAVERHHAVEHTLRLSLPALSTAQAEVLLARIRLRSAELEAPAGRREIVPRPWLAAAAAALLMAGIAWWTLSGSERAESPELDAVETGRTTAVPLPAEPEVVSTWTALDSQKARELRQRLRTALEQPADPFFPYRELCCVLPADLRTPSVLCDLLAGFLGDENFAIATHAAHALHDAMRSERVAFTAGLVPDLERALLRPELSYDAFGALSAIDSDAARFACLTALDVEALRPAGLRFFIGLERDDKHVWQQRSLRQISRAAQLDPNVQPLLAEALASLRIDSPQQLELILELHKDGVPDALLEGLVARAEGSAHAALIEGLEARPGSRARLSAAKALQLARIGPDPRWVPGLQHRVLIHQDPARAIDAMTLQAPTVALKALAEVWQDPRCSASERRLVLGGLLAVLQSPRFRTHNLAHVLAERRPALYEMLEQLPSARCVEILLALVEGADLSPSIRAEASLAVARLSAPPPQDRLLAVLRSEQQSRAQTKMWQPDVASGVLVALYSAHGRQGLRQGFDALGLRFSNQRSEQILRSVKAAASRNTAYSEAPLLQRVVAAVFGP